jgi:hypothetical protein
MSRGAFLRRLGGAGAALSLVGLLRAWDAGAAPAGANAAFQPSAGGTIPSATVRFGLKPFPDSTFYFIGMKRGYFKDVGINIEPKPFGLAVTPANVIQLLVNNDLDIATLNGPTVVKVKEQVPDLRLLGFADTYIATFLLASPDSGVEPVSKRIKKGMAPAAAIRAAMQELKGKSVGFNNAGSQRVFLNEVFTHLGGISFNDVNLTVTDDEQLIQLALGGKIQFATPDGSAQNVELLRLGWYPLVSVSDLALLPGSQNIVAASLSHEGPAAKLSYYTKNTETCLRLTSVMFRLIDEINKDMPGTLAIQAPYVKTRSGVDIGAKGLQTIFTDIDPLTPFEKQTQYWGKQKGNPQSYSVVYGEQIKAAQAGGILPAGKTYTPGDVTIGAQVYGTLVSLRGRYDKLAPQAKGLVGKRAALARTAKKHYEWRNYLDAYRLLREAVSA